jgi:hypothetical protein
MTAGAISQALASAYDGNADVALTAAPAVNTGALTTYTFSAQAVTGPCVVAVLWASRSSVTRTLSSITIDGVAAAGVGAAEPGNNIHSGIAYLEIGSDSAVDVVLTFSGSMLFCGIKVYCVTNYQSATPSDSFGLGFGGTSISDVIDVLSGGALLAVCMYSNTGAITLTGVTEDYDEIYDANSRVAGGSLEVQTTEAARTIQGLGTAGGNTLAAVAWR